MLIARSVLADERCRARLDAMLPQVETETVEVVADEAVEEALAALCVREELPRGGLGRRRQPKELVAFARLGDGDVFPGYRWDELRDAGYERHERGVRCQTAVEIQSAVGCPFDCTYCPYGAFLCVRLDVEAFVDRVTELTKRRPQQQLYKLNNRTDVLGLEPEYGLCRALIERFAELPDRYLMLYSKGEQVDHLVGLDHGAKTIGCFTLTPERVAATLEMGAPPPEARIDALSRLQQVGYPVRVRLSPIVPISGWRDDYAQLVEQLFAAADPEMVTLWTLSMVDYEDLEAIVPAASLDEDVRLRAQLAAERMRGLKGAPFPAVQRVAIYRHIAELVRAHSVDARLALCLETPQVWDAFAPWLGCEDGDEMLCNCGPRAIPLPCRQPRRRRQSSLVPADK